MSINDWTAFSEGCVIALNMGECDALATSAISLKNGSPSGFSAHRSGTKDRTIVKTNNFLFNVIMVVELNILMFLIC